MNTTYVPLHLHSEYSLLDGAIRVKELCEFAKANNMPAVAITDHGVMYSAIEFYRVAKETGVKALIGCEFYVHNGDIHEKNPSNNPLYHLVLIAKDKTGYMNLVKLVSIAHCEGMYYKPRINFELLEKYHEGLVCCSACLGGEVLQNLLKNDYEKAKATAQKYKDLFKDDYYIELQDHGLEEQTIINSGLRKLSKETGIPLVATNDCHYLHPEDYEAHDVLMAIQAKTSVTSDKRKKYGSDQFYVKSGKEMWDIFGKDEDTREALLNTCRIANRCNVTFKFGENKLPPFDVPSIYEKNGRTMDNETFFKTLIANGMKKRYGDNVPQEYWDRCKYEFDVIKKMGYVNYFLIVWDIFRFCKTGTEEYGLKPDPNWRPILTGPGRGSGAGSLILYALGVTHIDPMEYDLLFERFLDPSRVSMPDCILHAVEPIGNIRC